MSLWKARVVDSLKPIQSLWKAHVVDSLQPIQSLWKAHVVDSLQPIQVYESMEGTCGGQLTANTGI
ncbi:hypothetical protein DPMN_194285 [Dreissena polymorpha]|uniref:Uncharacterized protein n=1 Tax=Dreissena polymorpha TaxID=45954 RepID=A0A9D3Y1Z2_DREPO|nr:hypothetical protein DPMN_194285 [Dreissena polymorpha]